ncbi:MAG: PHB depolymerase family esterase [Polyangiales bacterium]
MRNRTTALFALFAALHALEACSPEAPATDSGADSAARPDVTSPSDAAQDSAAPDASAMDASAMDASAMDSSSNDAGDARDSGTMGAMDAQSDSATSARDAVADARGDSAADAGPFRSSTRQSARMLGYRGAPNGFYEYLPPEYDGAASLPLLVFWHGIGENGNGTTELSRVLANGPPRLINSDRWPAARPFIVLSAQHSGGGCPTSSEIQSFITWALANYRVDTTRVYLTGLSCGAIGSWSYLGDHTNTQIVAAVLIAGDGRSAWSRQMCMLGRVAIWGFHGDADDVVSPDGTRLPMNSLIACPSPPRRDARLTMYPGVGHDSWSRTYDLSAGHDIYSWLLTQRR